ncbi:uncharacterized protein LOC120354069 [Nilaparvata lugens]|uniref:uncharacterized protein LOC120354069 n=1 Tax=Nilaparvata lugens TaxID=108931 RepID=UPI00193CFC8E|nr:uncharacterized protein LOC120354069 [Nilaparvata lugens]
MVSNFPLLNKLRRSHQGSLADKYNEQVPMTCSEFYFGLDRKFDKLMSEYEEMDEESLSEEVILEFAELQIQFQTRIDSIKLVDTVPKPAVTTNELSINNFVKPQLQIPTFSGEPHEWNAFKNVFDAAVHTSKDYSSEAKYHLLTLYLSGDALTLVQNYANTTECYKAANDSLHKQYNNIRYQAYSLYNKFDTFVPSTTLAETLKKFSIELSSAKRSPFNMNLNQADFLITMMCIRKLPLSVCTKFEESLKMLKNP